jgi:hemoglobin
MRDAADTLGLTEEQDKRLWDYLVYAARSMVNSPT